MKSGSAISKIVDLINPCGIAQDYSLPMLVEKNRCFTTFNGLSKAFFGSRPAFLRFLGFLGKDDLRSRMKTAARIDS